MQKISTSSKKADLQTTLTKSESAQSLQPKAETLNNILQFAASYRVNKITDNQYVEWLLN